MPLISHNILSHNRHFPSSCDVVWYFFDQLVFRSTSTQVQATVGDCCGPCKAFFCSIVRIDNHQWCACLIHSVVHCMVALNTPTATIWYWNKIYGCSEILMKQATTHRLWFFSVGLIGKSSWAQLMRLTLLAMKCRPGSSQQKRDCVWPQWHILMRESSNILHMMFVYHAYHLRRLAEVTKCQNKF